MAEHIQYEIDKDWPAVHRTFVQDDTARWDVMPFCTTMHGIAGVREYEGFDAALPDFTVLVTGQYDVPGTSVVEGTITGTHKGEYCGIPASGLTVTAELCAVFEFGAGVQAGKIVTERVYFDNETIIRQMRGEEDAPTGVGLAGRVGA